MGRKQVRCHGDEKRFHALADLFSNSLSTFEDCLRHKVMYVADVAGGQGVLSRLLSKRLNVESEVVDPRHHTLVGVKHRQAYYTSDMADYYDVVIGLHPDQAIRPVVESSAVRPTILVPCCNFWVEERMSFTDMLMDIELWYKNNGVNYRKIMLNLETPYKHAYVTTPGLK